MDLTALYLDGKTEFSSYDDFYQNLKIKLPEKCNFVREVVDFYARKAPQKRALVWCDDEGGEEVFTFKQMSETSLALAHALLKKGIKKGDVVMLVLHRRYEYWFFVLALHRIGALALPVTSQLSQKDFEYRIKVSNTKMIVASPYETVLDFIEEAAKKSEQPPELVSVNFDRKDWTSYKRLFEEGSRLLLDYKNKADRKAQDPFPLTFAASDPLLMYFTSGSTDEPKLVVHNYLYPLAHIISAKYWQCVRPEGLHYTATETGWAKASWGKLYGQWIAGSAVFVYDRQGFNPEAILEKIQKYKIDSFCAPPTIYRYLANAELQKYDLSCLKHCTSAGESLRNQVIKKFYEKTGLHIYEGYGQTETSLLAGHFCFEESGAQAPKDSLPKGSMGRPSPAYDLRLVNQKGKECKAFKTGEIVINIIDKRPVGLMAFYSDNQPLTQGGLYHTGDLAKRDKKGFLYYVGRKDNMIKSSGFRISPYEVENVLEEHPAVVECAVVAQKNKSRGQIVKALVVPSPSFNPDHHLERELIAFVKSQTALYKCPRKIEFVKKLPKTYNGKIKRYNIKDEK